MAKFVLKDAVLTVAGTDLSDHASSVTVETTFDEVDLTGFQSTYREFGQGLGDATITASFFQDFAASEVDATLWTLSQTGGTFDVTVKASDASTSSTNPIFTMTSRLFSYSPIAGAVGDASTTDVTFRNAGTAGLTRGTS